jgi:F0F1-type ATP synthase assembly protein I
MPFTFRLRFFSQADTFHPRMSTDPNSLSDREKEIAKKRDDLLANARGEKGFGSVGGKPDPRLMGLGLQFVIAILLCLYIGMWLDKKLNTGPWLMMIGALIGASAGFYSMYSVMMSENKKYDEQHQQNKIDKEK